MKLCAFEVREDEKKDFELLARKYHCEVFLHEEKLNSETLCYADGVTGVTTLGQSQINKEILDGLKTRGIRYLNTRTIGYNHIDLTYARQIGIQVCNASYAPNGVADYTIMLMLLVLRH